MSNKQIGACCVMLMLTYTTYIKVREESVTAQLNSFGLILSFTDLSLFPKAPKLFKWRFILFLNDNQTAISLWNEC